MIPELFYKVGFFTLLTLSIGAAALLTYDLGFNDAKLTTKSIQKAQDLVDKYKGQAEKELETNNLIKNGLSNIDNTDVRDPLEKIIEDLGVTKEGAEDKTKITESRNLNTQPLVSIGPLGNYTFTFTETTTNPAGLEADFKKTWKLKKEFKVTSVADGDTIRGYYVADPNKTSQSIRITSIDTPESTSLTKPNVWQKTWGKKAGAFAKKLLFNTLKPNRKVYILETPETSHGRVVGSVWYTDKVNDVSDAITISSYAHDVVKVGLAIPARLKTQSYYSLDEGAGNNLGKGIFESYFEKELGGNLIKSAIAEVGFWSVSEDQDIDSSQGTKNDIEDYSTVQGWNDIFDGKFQYLDLDLPQVSNNDVDIAKMAKLIEYYVYPAITWWKSDDLKKRKTGTYCTLDTILKTSLKTGETGTVCPRLSTQTEI